MTNELWWYVARACGIVSWLLLAATVVWGLTVSGRLRRRPFTPAWLLDLHRHLGGLSLVFVSLHIAGLMADTYIHFGPAQVLVPMASAWRPGAVAWGVAALYLLLAVELTSLLRRAVPRRVWRATHLLSFPLFAASTVHLLQSGTDAHQLVAELPGAVIVTSVGAITAWRVICRRRPVRRSAIVPAGHEVTSPKTRPDDRFGIRKAAAVGTGTARLGDRPDAVGDAFVDKTRERAPAAS